MIAVLGVLVAVLLPAVNAAREAARRTHCINNLKQIGLGVINYESTTKSFPKYTNGRKYKWSVDILPYAEEVSLWENLSRASRGLSLNAWSQMEKLVDQSGRPYCDYQIEIYRCPSYSGPTTIDNPVMYPTAIGYPAVGNYIAFRASHLGVKLQGGVALLPIYPTLENPTLYKGTQTLGQGNAVIGSAGSGGDKVTIDDVQDGLSKTIMVTESREQEYASWYATFPSWEFPALDVGYYSQSVADNPSAASDGHLTANQTSLNVTPYYPGLFVSIYKLPQRDWGPSSEHAGGVINHLFADGHVISVSENADPSMYLRLITRAGGEQVNEEAL